jgi:hypothetical protein
VSSISATKLALKSNNKTIQIPLLQQLPPATTIPDNQSINNITNITADTEQGSEIFSSHSIQESLENETLPPAEEMFDDHQTLEFESLDKTFTINDGDYSECPPEYYSNLMRLMSEFKDRFSTSKLDLETTTIYKAKLPTLPGKVVNQKCRRLPHHKYQFAIKAIGQLEKAGVVRKSDSPWRSNVVLVPKPSEKNELRENSKASQLTGEHNMSTIPHQNSDFTSYMCTANCNGIRTARCLYGNFAHISGTIPVLYIHERLQRDTNIFTKSRLPLLYLRLKSLAKYYRTNRRIHRREISTRLLHSHVTTQDI